MTDVVEAMARALLARRGFGFYTNPMEGGQDAYDISCEAIEEARAAIRACRDAGGLVVGKMPGEQQAFEAWAISQSLDMAQHPLHYLFLDPKTYAARQAWKAAVGAVRAAAVEVE